MSKVVIQGNASGTGDFTIAAPNSNTDRTLTLPDAGGTLDRLDRAGNVLQVVSTLKTSVFSTTATSPTDITGFSVTITPSSASSKILVVSSFTVNEGSVGAYPRCQLVRNSTAIGLGDARGSATRVTTTTSTPSSSSANLWNVAYTILDSPSTTSATTYKWQTYGFSSRVVTINGTQDSGDSNRLNASSTITVMEIAA